MQKDPALKSFSVNFTTGIVRATRLLNSHVVDAYKQIATIIIGKGIAKGKFNIYKLADEANARKAGKVKVVMRSSSLHSAPLIIRDGPAILLSGYLAVVV